MTDGRPAQPGPPGDPPEPPGGRPVEERVTVVETRLDDLPTKGDLAEGLAKSDRRLGKRIDALSESVGKRIDALSESVGKRIDALSESVGKRIDALGVALGKQISEANAEVGKRLDAFSGAMRSQVLIYMAVTSLMMTILFGISGFVMEWRDEQRQKVVEDVQQVQQAQGETLKEHGEMLKEHGEMLKEHGEALDALQRQVNRLVEYLMRDGDAERGPPPQGQGGRHGR